MNWRPAGSFTLGLVAILGCALAPIPAAAQLTISVTGSANWTDSTWKCARSFQFSGSVTSDNQSSVSSWSDVEKAVQSGASVNFGGPVSQTLTVLGNLGCLAPTTATQDMTVGVSPALDGSGYDVTVIGAWDVSYSVTFNANGLTGTPTNCDPSAFCTGGSVTITAGSTSTGGSTPLTITTTSYPTATLGQAYQPFQFQAKGGNQPYSWSWSGDTPPGMQLTSGGIMEGTPTVANFYTFTVTVKDSSGQTYSETFDITVHPNGTLSINTTPAPPQGTVGTPYGPFQFSAANGTQPYTWSWVPVTTSGGNTVPGLTLSSAGSLSGTPTTAGTYQVTVIVQDNSGQSANANFTLVIVGPALTVSTTQLPQATLNAPYSPLQLQAANGKQPYTWSTSGNIPQGMQVTPGGLVEGTPTHPGSYPFTVTVTDATNATASANLTLVVVVAPLTILTTQLPPGTVGAPYGPVQLQATGGTQPYNWQWSGNATATPPGLSVTNSEGVGSIGGTPTAAGTYDVILNVADTTGEVANQELTLVISAPTQPTGPSPDTLGPAGTTTNPTGSYAEPVNTATGNYYTTQTDLTVHGRGLDFVFNRFYNSQDNYNGPVGANWNHSYNISLSVDGSGNVTIRQPQGGSLAFAPNATGGYSTATTGCYDLLSQNPDGTFVLTHKNQVKLTFSATGALVSVADRNGNTQTMTRSAGGDLIAITDTVGRVFTLTYDGNHRVLSLADPTGRTVSYSYDSSGNLASVTNPAAGKIVFAYDASHRLTSAIDPRGVTYVANTYDGNGRVIAQTNGNGDQTYFVYNATQVQGYNITAIHDGNGNLIQHAYDTNLRLIGVIDGAFDLTVFGYDGNNNRTSLQDGDGNNTTFIYDSMGNALSVTDAAGNTTSIAYDALNDPTSIIDPAGHTTVLSYDQNGNRIGTQDAMGNRSGATYDGFGEVLTATDAAGDVTQFTWDNSGNLAQVVDGAGRKTGVGYDALGRRISTTDGLGHVTKFQYDSLDRLTVRTDALGSQTQYTYDATGDVLSATDANGNTSAYAYDGDRNLVTMQDSMGQKTTYVYDGNDNRIQTSNARGKITGYGYDGANRLTAITDPLGRTTSKTYDGAGNLVSVTDGNGNTTQLGYDADNRLTGVTYSDGSTVTEAYDVNGNRTSMTDTHGTNTYTYDALNRVTSATRFDGAAVGYSYDAAGRRTSLTYPDGHALKYAYDGASKLTQVTDWNSQATAYSYDGAGNLVSTAFPNQVAGTRSYDNANRLLSISNSGPAGVLSSYTYALDALGNRLQVTDRDGGVTKYTYDNLYRLTAALSASGQRTQYTYDAVGNRTAVISGAGMLAYTYDDADQTLTAGSTSFTYDGNGSRLTKTAGGNQASYTWNPANRLVAISGNGINMLYDYDGDGNRISQQANGSAYSYVNDSARRLTAVLNEQGPDGNIDYQHGLSLFGMNTAGGTQYLSVDGVGSTATVSDGGSTVKADYDYDPFGNLLNPVDPLGSKEKYKFAGQALDSASGLYYMRARYYDAATGRFLSRDPLEGARGSPWDRNPYAYARNNGLAFGDPSGMSAEPIWSVDPGAAPSSCLLWVCGASISVGGTAYGGLGTGAGATATAGFGVFGGPGGGTTSGAFYQGGAFNGSAAVVPTNKPDVAWGAGWSIGPSAYVTNGESTRDLSGPFSTQILTLGILEIQKSVGITDDGRKITVYSVGAGLGFGYARLTTNTPCTTALGTCPALEGPGQ
jgi:RHS repeat-associated protein